MIKRLRYKKWKKIIEKSGLFDVKYYLFTYPDVRLKDINPVMHYIKYGANEGRNPNKEFDTSFYLTNYLDVKESKMNPLVHYILYGRKENRKINNLKKIVPENAQNKNVVLPKITYKETKKEFVEYQQHEPLNTKLKTIAFYLPQFHPFPENDKWWGKGFTEWTNVTKAKPNFAGHYQPHFPIHSGFYDLRVPEVMIDQAKLARNYGIYGFNFYYYWFDGKILMEKPYEILLKHKEIDINFCITWANENWTRRWDGAEHDILMGQNHCEEDSTKFLESLYKYFEDDRYIRIDNKPVLIIYRADIIPNMKETVTLWREKIKEAGFDGIYLICSQTFGIKSPTPFGFDAAMEFPPHTAQSTQINKAIDFTNKDFGGVVYDYPQVVENACKSEEPEYKLFRTTMLSWDNTARKQNASHMFYNFSLLKYKQWFSHLVSNVYNNKKYGNDEKFVFVNAWNEWAEGTHLEPDRKFGYGYLESTHSVIKEYSEKIKDIDILIVLDNNADDSFVDVLKWFKKRTLLNIFIVNIGTKSNNEDIRIIDCSKLVSFIESLDVKIKSIYLHNNNIDEQSLINLSKTTIPIVFNSHSAQVTNKVDGIKYINIRNSENNFELKLLEVLYNKTDLKPKVSVIVPSYNHENFLKKRLDSILNQTFQDFELIIIDDCSKDNSLSVINKYTTDRPSSFSFSNSINSGTPFKQWAKGINKSRGEIIWIAEDDDYCEDTFLEKLLPSFGDKRVKLAFSQSHMIDENENIIGNYNEIFSTISQTKWDENYNIAAHKEVMASLAIRNTIPNVSAVLFKRINIDNIVDKLVQYKFAGDWFFYLNLLSEGNIAFVKEPLNYHRRHAQSTMAILSDDSKLYFNELKNIHDFVLDNFVLDESTLIKMRKYIESEYKYKKIDITNTDLYPIDRLSINLNYKKQKNIAVFFSGYYFGGAEIFPINLANAFAELGHNVFLFDVGSLDTDEKVKAMVSPLVHKCDIKGTKNSQQDLKDFLEKNKIDVINTQGWFGTDFIQKNLTWNIHYIPWFASMHGHEEAIINGEWGEHYFKYFDKAIKNTIKKSPYFIYTHPKNLEVFEKYPLKDKEKLIELELLGMSSSLPDRKLKSQLEIPKESFVVGFVARGIPEKGWEESIEAVHILNRDYNLDVHLVCIGDSDYVQDLKSKNIEKYIHFLGMSDEVMEWTQMFDVALLPSFYKSESHPLVIMGYLLAGKPVITTPLGNIPEMIDYNGEKAGYLVDLNFNGRPSPQSISEHIKKYIEDKELYSVHSQLAKKAFEKFNMKNIANQYIDTFLVSSKKTLYIHMGSPKTGTSAIQKFLVANDDVLKSKYDLYYPKFGRWVDGSHHEIAFALDNNSYVKVKADGEQKLYLEELEKDIIESNCQNILLSSECFLLYNNKNFISKFNNKYNIKIICYIRRQDEYVESLYMQNVRDNVIKETKSFTGYLDFQKDILFFSNILQRWESVTKSKNFIVKVYEKEKFINNNIIDDFMDVFSISVNSKDFLIDTSKVNESFTKSVLEYKLLINKVLDKPSDKLVYILNKYSAFDKRSGGKKLNLFDANERKKFINIFHEDNQKIIEKYNLKYLELFNKESIENTSSNPGLNQDKILDITNFIAKSDIEVISEIHEGFMIKLKNVEINDELILALKSAIDKIIKKRG